MNKLELKNISYFGKDKIIIKSFDCAIKKGDNLTILGGPASGKTTLSKVFENSIKYDGTYKINNIEISDVNKYNVDRYVSVINNEYIDNNKKIVDILFESLDEFAYGEDDKKDRIDEITKYFNIDYLDNKLNEVTKDKYYYIKIVISYLKMYDYIVLDNILCYLNKKQIEKIYSYANERKISIINITSNIKEVLYSNYSIYIYNGLIALEGDTLLCLKEEKIIRRLGFNLPFIYDLSLQLKYYNVIDDICLDERSLIDKIWN